jgi:pyruvate formate-lyase activating enzyme-like uncharacterized protein
VVQFSRKHTEVLDEVEALQSALPGLHFHQAHQSVSTGPLVPGCQICVRKGYLSFQVGFACNASCPFCFLQTRPPDQQDPDERYHRQALLKRFLRRKDDLEGVSLTGGEPLLYMAELEECVSQMRAAKPGLHLWVYTNGILASRERLRALRQLGVAEIRFNLAATNYGARVLGHLAEARDIFPHLVAEVPSYPPQQEALLHCLPQLQRIGLDQLNLQELWLTEANVAKLAGEGYQAGVLMASKFFLYGSRRMSYEIMAHCLAKGYSFTVNDCTAGEFGRS